VVSPSQAEISDLTAAGSRAEPVQAPAQTQAVTDGAPFLAASKPCWMVRPKIEAWPFSGRKSAIW
jgi:hypothetical protein